MRRTRSDFVSEVDHIAVSRHSVRPATQRCAAGEQPTTEQQYRQQR
jgi:hypothetical protein